jgi:Domain of unknown function (DUF4824)
MTRRVLPALIVIVANAAILIGVAVNRSGEPDAVVTMTERELPMRFGSDRDSGQQLLMRIDRSGYPYQRWLTPAKLEALGFDVSAPATSDSARFYSRQLPRRAFVVLEYDGPSWHNVLNELNELRGRQNIEIEREERLASRLAPIDASTDAAALRQAYPDRRMHIIVPATIRIQIGDYRSADRLTGYVSLVTSSLVVPRESRAVLDNLSPSSSMYGADAAGPRYTATVAYGTRREPWIVSVERIDSPASSH